MFITLCFYAFMSWIAYQILFAVDKKRLPKQYAPKNIKPVKEEDGNIRNGFSKRKIPENIDTIVIGSGIGGLTCAGLLAKVGKKVLVLEQHYLAGGCTHNFEDKGFEFDTGVHYMGNITKRKKILDLITFAPIEWDRMGNKDNDYIYDEINVEGKMYNFKSGEKNFVDELSTHFPEERENIIRYLDAVKKVAGKDLFFSLKIVKNPIISKIIKYFYNDDFVYDLNITALEAVKSFTKNETLQAVLLGQFGDYGKVPSKESFFVHSSIVNHYLNGGWYPRGGSSEFAKKIIPTIQAAGGDVLVRKAVKQILIENNVCNGVEMVDGTKIYAKNVISGCGAANTWLKLVPDANVPMQIKQNIENLGYSCSFVYLFVGLDGEPDEFDFRSSNIWHWPNKDYDTMIEKFLESPETAPIPLFIGFPCAKDTTWRTRFPGKSNAVILTMADYSMFEKWKDERPGHRDQEYQTLKDMFANRILEEGLYHYYPKTKGKVVYKEVGSPLTFNHYIGSQRGEAYGLENAPIRFQDNDWLKPDTHIKNLYQTGQDVTTLGITGAMMSGVLTASSVLGYGTLSDILTQRNLVRDLCNT